VDKEQASAALILDESCMGQSYQGLQ